MLCIMLTKHFYVNFNTLSEESRGSLNAITLLIRSSRFLSVPCRFFFQVKLCVVDYNRTGY